MELPRIANKYLVSGMEEWLKKAQPDDRLPQATFAFDTDEPHDLPTVQHRLEELREADNNCMQFSVLANLGMLGMSNATAAQLIDVLSLKPVRAAEIDQDSVTHRVPQDRVQKPNATPAEDGADRRPNAVSVSRAVVSPGRHPQTFGSCTTENHGNSGTSPRVPEPKDTHTDDDKNRKKRGPRQPGD